MVKPSQVNYIFCQTTSHVALLKAHRKALKGKRANHYATNFDYDITTKINALHDNLVGHTYTSLGYRNKTIIEPKERRIEAPAYRDRIVHHALHAVLNPVYEKLFIPDCYACRPKRGIHKATLKVQKILRTTNEPLYVCQMDISKYYASINHAKLLSILNRQIIDEPLLQLINIIISSTDSGTEHDHLFETNSYYHTKGRRGIPIGNLTSQLFANIYLHELDMYTKQQLKVRHYVRYMDDILFFHTDKKVLRKYQANMVDFLYEQLYLTINPRKVRVYPARHGVSFVGYIIYPFSMRLRSSSVRNFKKKYKKLCQRLSAGEISPAEFDASFNAWKAHASHANTYHLVKSLEKQIPHIQLRLFDDSIFS